MVINRLFDNLLANPKIDSDNVCELFLIQEITGRSSLLITLQKKNLAIEARAQGSPLRRCGHWPVIGAVQVFLVTVP